MIQATAKGVLEKIRKSSFTPPPAKPKPIKCQACGDKGFLRGEKDGYPFVTPCECKRRRDAMQAIQDSGMPNAYLDATLKPGAPKSWMPTATSEHRAFEVAQGFIHAVIHWKTKGGQAPWLVLKGDVGVGKTMLACATMGDLARSGIYRVHFCQMTLITNAITAAISVGDSEYDVLAPIQHADIAILDDLNPSQVRNPDQFGEKAERVIFYRHNKNLPTIITTNDNERTLRELLGGPVMSRVLGNAAWVEITGDDKRQRAEEEEI